MQPYTAETYGERVADVYDEWYKDYDPAAVDPFLELAGSGRALELAERQACFALSFCGLI